MDVNTFPSMQLNLTMRVIWENYKSLFFVYNMTFDVEVIWLAYGRTQSSKTTWKRKWKDFVMVQTLQMWKTRGMKFCYKSQRNDPFVDCLFPKETRFDGQSDGEVG